MPVFVPGRSSCEDYVYSYRGAANLGLGMTYMALGLHFHF